MAQTQKQRWAQDIHAEKVAERAGQYINGRAARTLGDGQVVLCSCLTRRGNASEGLRGTTRKMAVHVAHLHSPRCGRFPTSTRTR